MHVVYVEEWNNGTLKVMLEVRDKDDCSNPYGLLIFIPSCLRIELQCLVFRVQITRVVENMKRETLHLRIETVRFEHLSAYSGAFSLEHSSYPSERWSTAPPQCN